MKRTTQCLAFTGQIVSAWILCGRILMGLSLCLPAEAASADRAQKQILLCVSEKASPAIRQAADELARQAGQVAVLKGLLETQGAGPVVRQSSEAVLKNSDLAAYNHLIVIGLKSADPLMTRVWEQYATVDESARTVYMQGWGYLKGDIGYVESDRNPFLHSRRIPSAPFETTLFKLSGTSEKGVVAAVKAFMETGMLNGLVPVGPTERPQQTLLDLDPLTVGAPLSLPRSVRLRDHTGKEGEAPLVGWTQTPANEYRAYLDVAQIEPVHLWRVKYLEPNALDRAGVEGWMAGFHRMAYGNAVTIAEFASPADAQKTALAIVAGNNGWRKWTEKTKLPAWQADQPTDENMPVPLGKILLTVKGKFLLLSSLPATATAQLLESVP